MSARCTPWEAITIVGGDVAAWSGAAKLLANRALQGALSVEADEVSKLDELGHSVASMGSRVPSELWAASAQWSDDDWRVGDFSAPVGWGCLLLATGVTFERAEVEALPKLPTASSATPAPASQRTEHTGDQMGRSGGAPPKVDQWHAIYMEILRLLDDGELNKQKFPSQKRLREHLLIQLQDSLSDDALRAPIRHVYYRFIDRSAGE